MATFAAAYVRLDTVLLEPAVTRIVPHVSARGAGGPLTLRARAGNPWIQIHGVNESTGPLVARDLSAAFSSTSIVILAEGISDAFAYWRFNCGTEVRHLLYSWRKGGWEEVRGEPEDWEKTILFGRRPLSPTAEKAMQRLALRLGRDKPALSGESKPDKLVQGASEPSFSVTFGGLRLGEYFGLPGFENMDTTEGYWTLEREIA